MFETGVYLAEALAKQSDDLELKARFERVALALRENEGAIVQELNLAQGTAQDIGGYYRPDAKKASSAIRGSETFNAILNQA